MLNNIASAHIAIDIAGAARPARTRLLADFTAMRNLLIFIAILLTQSAHAAVNWIDIAKLPNVREASRNEISAFIRAYGKSMGGYNLTQGDVRILVHEGNLTVNQSVVSGDIVVVKGDLKISGNYHDYMGGGIGVLFVDGTMEVDNLYSWGALYVAKDLRARGVVLTVYNDFTFEVKGHVAASALIVSDKSSNFKVQGKVAQLGDHGNKDEQALALRILRPELFSGVDHFEFEYDSSWFSFDDERGQQYIRAGRSLLRDKPAAPALTSQLKEATATNTSVARLKTLIGNDPLLAQVIAARPDKSAALFEPLFATNDPVVREWLTAAHPKRVLGRIKDGEITGAIAQLLVKAEVDAPTTARLAKSKDAAVRAALAEVRALDRKWVNALANDRDESVRREIIRNHPTRLSHSTIEMRLADVPDVLEALVLAPLTADQINRVLPKLNPNGVTALAGRLRDWRLGDAATALSSGEIDQFALRLLADPRNTNNVARDEAFLALSGKAQVANFDPQISNKKVSIGSVARSTHSVAVLEKIIAHCNHRKASLPEEIASNPRLTPAMQRLIFDRGVKALREVDSDALKTSLKNLILSRSTQPHSDGAAGLKDQIDALETLLGEEHASSEIIELALAELLKSGHFSAPLSHHTRYSPAQIKRLFKHFHGSEDWALSLLLQPRIQPEELLPSLARWYDDPDEQRELKQISSLKGDALFRALAKAKSAKLREAAARNVATPADVLIRLTKDPDDEVARTAKRNSSLPVDLQVQFAVELDDGDAIKSLALAKPGELSAFVARLPELHPTRVTAEQEIRKLKAMAGDK